MTWPRVKNDLVNLVIEKSRGDTKVIYVPGNHDELMRDFIGQDFNGIDLRRETVHKTADGRRLLILHGDVFDEVVRHPRILDFLGNSAYELIMSVSRNFNRLRKRFGYGYWSFAKFIKYRFGEAVRYIERFEQAASAHATRLGFDGIVCGHIHHPNNIEIDGAQYLNTGDWVEHCTALTEDESGRLEIIDWLRFREQLAPRQVPSRHAA
ncbi:MAG: UDP-2,3-diacylglucosamine diphosphatase [Gammaproteobacteria bacterium]|nr:UDP-2,3-diacylglucosamine diphosphatase [Gammaproteobacteria bacterium]